MSQEGDENGVNNSVSKRRDPGDEAGSLFDNAGLDCSSNALSGNNPQQIGTADNSLSTTQPTYANRMPYASRAANESISSRSNMRQQILSQLEADSRIGIGRSNGVTIPSSSSSEWNQEARSAAITSANPINSLPNAGEVSLGSLASSSNQLLNQHGGRAIGVPNHVNEQNKHLLVPETSSAHGGQASLGLNVNDRALSSSSKKRCRLSGAPGMDVRQRSNSNSITPIDSMPLLATGSFTPSSTTAGFGRSSNDAALSQIRNNDVASLLLPPQQQIYHMHSPGMQQQEPSFAPALGLPQSSSGNNVSNRAFGSVPSPWIPPPSQQTLPSQPALQFRRPHLSPSQWPPAPGGVMVGVDPQQQQQQHSLELLLRSQQHRQTLGGIQHQEATNFDRAKNNNFRTNNYHDISPSYLNNMEQIANTRPVQRRRIADGSLVAASPGPSSQILYPQNFYLPSQQSHHLTGLQMPHNFGLPSANVASLSLGNPVVQHQHAQEEQTKSKKSRRKPRIFKTFQERFDELIEYKREHGHCNVPRRYGPDKSLGVWCNNIRYSFRQLQGGKHPHNFISEEDIRRLDEIGFQWKLKSNPSSTDDAKESAEQS